MLGKGYTTELQILFFKLINKNTKKLHISVPCEILHTLCNQDKHTYSNIYHFMVKHSKSFFLALQDTPYTLAVYSHCTVQQYTRPS
jgi:hypothetical protein